MQRCNDAKYCPCFRRVLFQSRVWCYLCFFSRVCYSCYPIRVMLLMLYYQFGVFFSTKLLFVLCYSHGTISHEAVIHLMLFTNVDHEAAIHLNLSYLLYYSRSYHSPYNVREEHSITSSPPTSSCRNTAPDSR